MIASSRIAKANDNKPTNAAATEINLNIAHSATIIAIIA